MVVVSFFALLFAIRAANAAVETLRLEAEPVVTARLTEAKAEFMNTWYFSTEKHLTRALIEPTQTNQVRACKSIEVANVGRSPAFNVRFTVKIRIEGSEPWIPFVLAVGSLAPKEQFIFGIGRFSGEGRLQAFFQDAQRGSFSRRGEMEPIRFLLNGPEFPITI